MSELITISDLLIVPFLLIIIYIISRNIKTKYIEQYNFYKYFNIGLTIKIFSGITFALIYLFYYGGGDTVYYFLGTQSTIQLGNKDFLTFIKILGGNHSDEVFSIYDRTTGWPTYWHDINSFAVCRFNIPFYLMGLGSYLGNTIVMNFILYLGIWRFYKMLMQIYPKNYKSLAYALFFIPGVVFWSSGILKDGWTLTATLFIYTNIYQIFIAKNKVWKNMFLLLLWSYILFSIRPFIFYASIVSALVWVGFTLIRNIEGKFLRIILFPIIALLIWFLGLAIMTQTSSIANNRYASIDNMIETAWVIQDDLSKAYYGGNSFDIGDFEPSLYGILKMMPKAIIAGLFRPFIWEAKGILMLVSGLENFIMLLITTYLLFKLRFKHFFLGIYNDSFLLTLFVLCITLAFTVGLTTANFGSLVRYAIPAKLAYIIILVQLLHNYKKA